MPAMQKPVRRWLLLSVLHLVLAALVASGCGDGGAPGGSEGTPIDELIAAGKAPVEVTGLSRSMGPIPTFRGSIQNLSASNIDMISWTAVFLDRDGKPVGEPVPGGYAEALQPVEPGERIEGMFLAPAEEAVSVRVIVKDVVYRKPNPANEMLGELRMKWQNPGHDAEVAAAQGR